MTARLDDSWWLLAACRGQDDPDIWFSNEPEDQAAAVAICGRCDVVEQCLIDAALHGETEGIRGGRIRGGRGPQRARYVPASAPLPLPEGVEHGTNSSANYYGCKCVECRERKAIETRRARVRCQLERQTA